MSEQAMTAPAPTSAPAEVRAESIANWLGHQASGISPLCTWSERKTERAMLLEAAKKIRDLLTALSDATADAARLRGVLKKAHAHLCEGESVSAAIVVEAALSPTPPAVATVAPPCPRTDRACLFPECGCNAPTPSTTTWSGGGGA